MPKPMIKKEFREPTPSPAPRPRIHNPTCDIKMETIERSVTPDLPAYNTDNQADASPGAGPSEAPNATGSSEETPQTQTSRSVGMKSMARLALWNENDPERSLKPFPRDPLPNDEDSADEYDDIPDFEHEDTPFKRATGLKTLKAYPARKLNRFNNPQWSDSEEEEDLPVPKYNKKKARSDDPMSGKQYDLMARQRGVIPADGNYDAFMRFPTAADCNMTPDGKLISTQKQTLILRPPYELPEIPMTFKSDPELPPLNPRKYRKYLEKLAEKEAADVKAMEEYEASLFDENGKRKRKTVLRRGGIEEENAPKRSYKWADEVRRNKGKSIDRRAREEEAGARREQENPGKKRKLSALEDEDAVEDGDPEYGGEEDDEDGEEGFSYY